MARTAMRPSLAASLARGALVSDLSLPAAAVRRSCSAVNVKSRMGCLPARSSLHRCVHDLAEAAHAPEHRHWRRRRRAAAGDRMGSATGEIGLEPLIYSHYFLWTPPHFWRCRSIAPTICPCGVLMLPVVAGRAATTRQILIYSALLVPSSVLPWALGCRHDYGVTALICGAILIVLARQLIRSSEAGSGSCSSPVRVFHSYLFVLSRAVSSHAATAAIYGHPRRRGRHFDCRRNGTS